MQLQVHCHPLLIQPGIQCHLDEIRLDIHRACYSIAVLVNVVRIKYRFVSWIELNYIVFSNSKFIAL